MSRRVLLGAGLLAIVGTGVRPARASSTDRATSTGRAPATPATTPPPVGATPAVIEELADTTPLTAQPTPTPEPTEPTLATAPPTLATAPPTKATAPPTKAEIQARYAGAPVSQWGTNVARVCTALPTSDPVLALTFDACGGPQGSGYDAALIALLRNLAIPATLFLSSPWQDANPTIARELAADPLFAIGNHGSRHVPLSVQGRSAYGIAGTRNAGEVYDEVETNATKLAGLLGKPTTMFRTGTAYYDDVATNIVTDLAMTPIGFTLNADCGATYSSYQVANAMQGCRPGAITLAHMNRPRSGTAAGMSIALPALLKQGFRFVQVSDYLN